MNRHFVLVDVFTDRPFAGNQLAVFPDGRGLDDGQMQTLAREMNFSESTFLLPPEIPGAVKRVRIFTRSHELPMAGHPTVGTAAVLAERGEIPVPGTVTLQLGIGPVTVAVEHGPFVWMSHRPAEFGPVRQDRERVARALGLEETDLHLEWPAQTASTGTPFLLVPLRSLDAARRCWPVDPPFGEVLGGLVGFYVFTTEAVEADVHARMFWPLPLGLGEDPASGSAAAPLGAYLARYGMARFVVEQGVEIGRPSRIHVETEPELRIGGRAVIVGRGEIEVE